MLKGGSLGVAGWTGSQIDRLVSDYTPPSPSLATPRPVGPRGRPRGRSGRRTGLTAGAAGPYSYIA